MFVRFKVEGGSLQLEGGGEACVCAVRWGIELQPFENAGGRVS